MVEKYDGRFSRLLELAGGSAAALLQLVLTEFPCYRDSATFHTTPVSFHKRAQILVADIWCLFAGGNRTPRFKCNTESWKSRNFLQEVLHWNYRKIMLFRYWKRLLF